MSEDDRNNTAPGTPRRSSDGRRPPDATLPGRIAAAARRLEGRAVRTSCAVDDVLSRAAGARVLAKAEHLQHTGSFKLRGALNKVLGLSREKLSSGVVTASSGNHGAAVAYACRDAGATCEVFVAEVASPGKVAKIRALGGQIRVVGTDGVEAERAAREEAERSGRVFVSPYNDVDVIAGQGTIGKEIVEDAEPLDRLYVAVGGGGLIGGIASWFTKHSPNTVIVGVQPKHSAVMLASIEAGKILDLPSLPTLSDGTAGGIEADAITFPLALALVDEWRTVEEAEIAAALELWSSGHAEPIEGAAGLAIAAMLQDAGQLTGSTGVVLCGGNR